MSTSEQSQPGAAATAPEELVAYLDGELSPEECRRVEDRLARDADYRQQLRALDQAWEALDALPATTVDDDFARTTIEMVTVAAQREQLARTASGSVRRGGRRWWALGGVAAAFVVGFVAARQWLPDRNAWLVGELPTITQLDLLQQIQEVEFVRRLAREVPHDQLVSDRSAVARKVEQIRAASAPSPAARQEWVASLSDAERASLAGQANQFEALHAEDRDRLRRLEQEIAAAPDADELTRTLAAYGQWLARRTSGEQSKLRRMSTEERLQQIHEWIREEERQAARRLTPEDAERLRQVIRKIFEERKAAFIEWRQRRERDDRRPRGDWPHDGTALIVAYWALRNDDADDRTQQRIISSLSGEAEERLSRLSRRGGDWAVKQQLWHWMRDAMMPQPQLEAGDLERYFAEELDNDQRERLLSLPREQMEAELEQMYYGSRFGLRGREWLGGFGPPGRRPPGPGGPVEDEPRWRADGRRPFGGPDGDRFEPGRRGPGPGPAGPGGPVDRREGPPPDRPPFPPPEGGPPNDPPQEGRGGEEPIV